MMFSVILMANVSMSKWGNLIGIAKWLHCIYVTFLGIRLENLHKTNRLTASFPRVKSGLAARPSWSGLRAWASCRHLGGCAGNARQRFTGSWLPPPTNCRGLVSLSRFTMTWTHERPLFSPLIPNSSRQAGEKPGHPGPQVQRIRKGVHQKAENESGRLHPGGATVGLLPVSFVRIRKDVKWHLKLWSH